MAKGPPAHPRAARVGEGKREAAVQCRQHPPAWTRAGAFPNPSVQRVIGLGFHFSQGGSWQVSGASGKFSPSWWGDLVHKSAVRLGQDYSLA